MNKTFILIAITVAALLMSEANACGLFTSCCPPPPCCGGCVGRKKREALELPVKTQESDPCPQKGWQKVMEQALTDDPTSSTYAVQGNLYKTFNSKFFVSCAEKTKVVDTSFVANGEGYCSYGNEKIWCQAIALLG